MASGFPCWDQAPVASMKCGSGVPSSITLFPRRSCPAKTCTSRWTNYGCYATGSPIMNPFLHGRWRRIIRASSRYFPGYALIPPPGLPITAPSRLSWQHSLSGICGTARSCHPHFHITQPTAEHLAGLKAPHSPRVYTLIPTTLRMNPAISIIFLDGKWRPRPIIQTGLRRLGT